MNYVYHPIQGTKLVSDGEYEKHLSDGWFDSPAKFPASELAKKEEAPSQTKQGQPQLPTENLSQEGIVQESAPQEDAINQGRSRQRTRQQTARTRPSA